MQPLAFETHPDRYRHWRLSVDGAVATLVMDIREDEPLSGDPNHKLKLNSYDLGVDIELADAVERLRFEHPAVRAVVIRSGKERVFCAGANIPMLGSSTHAFKVNFCKFTNETRLTLEEASAASGQRYIAAVSGPCAGGGYELAMACDRIVLVDDGASTVSLPEVPLLGVLPGTGGLTRLVDKRKVRRDLADVFCTTAEGIKGRRARDWGLVDAIAPRSRFDQVVAELATELAAGSEAQVSEGVVLRPLEPEISADGVRYRHVTLAFDRARRTARLTVMGPQGPAPRTAAEARALGSDWWPLAAFRELDDALLRLRFNEAETGVVEVATSGDIEAVRESDATLVRLKDDWFVREVLLKMGRVLRRMDVTARTFFAVVEPGSCFAGSLLELALASDRTYVKDDPEHPVFLATSELNGGALLMSHGVTRLAVRLMAAPERIAGVVEAKAPFTPEAAFEAGLATVVADELDFDDELRIAIEERASLSPDALTGMEASLRYPGAETMESKIFGRLSAWQNWIFTRPNATGERGALTVYGAPEGPVFDWRRT